METATKNQTTAKTATKAKSEGENLPFKQAKRAAAVLKQISDPTRVLIVTILAANTQNVGEICAAVKQSQPAVSHHLALLRHGGVIECTRQGKHNIYSLTELGGRLAKSITAMSA